MRLIKEEEEKDKVKTYDFRSPIKLSKEYINTLYMIFENFSKMAGNTVSNLIHTNVEIKIGAIEQVSFDEFMHSIPNPTLLGLFQTKQFKGIQIIEINPHVYKRRPYFEMIVPIIKCQKNRIIYRH